MAKGEKKAVQTHDGPKLRSLEGRNRGRRKRNNRKRKSCELSLSSLRQVGLKTEEDEGDIGAGNLQNHGYLLHVPNFEGGEAGAQENGTGRQRLTYSARRHGGGTLQEEGLEEGHSET